jgi:hypothetical protein
MFFKDLYRQLEYFFRHVSDYPVNKQKPDFHM